MTVNINHFSQPLVSGNVLQCQIMIDGLLVLCLSFISFTCTNAAGLTEQIKLDRYLHPHFRYYMREVRTVVYSQFLESYKSVTIEAMAKAFGVSVEFIDL